ncbi:Cholecystokinin receptor [Holothuria leucospilota]|uniref:Cholecystokinin receptor n=1 Tax=Holothuria leucospilota TaxID=206669 RepID=A0A9Q1BQ07_HOLLE|nr:Cholecystokinin receptor [Holothuria leucospilota]
MEIPASTIQSHTPESSTDTSMFSGLNLIQLLIGIMGIIGNFLVCFIFLHKRTQRNQINLLITNQAFIDLFSSVLLVMHQMYKTVGNFGIKGDILQAVNCYLWRSQLILFSTFAVSTFNLTVISVERYFATIYPLSYKKVFTRKNMRYLIAAVWLISPILQYVIVWQTYTYRNGHCDIEWSLASVGVLLFFWEYMAPVSVMTFSFFCITRRLKQLNQIVHGNVSNAENGDDTQPETSGLAAISSGPSKDERGESMTSMRRQHPRQTPIVPYSPAATHQTLPTSNQIIHRDNEVSIRRRNVTKALLVVYLVYVICWSPNQWAFFQLNLGGRLNYGNFFYKFSIVLAISNSCVNPFIYAFRHKAYRERLKELWRGCSFSLCL